MLLVGFVAALRRSELASIRIDDLEDHFNGLVLTIPRSKINQTGEQSELVVLPRAANPARCPVTAIQRRQQLSRITTGPLLQAVLKSNKAAGRPLNPASINAIVQDAVRRAGMIPDGYSAHSLRAGFTYAHLRGASDRAIAHQNRHRSLATLGTYVRVQQAWVDNAATTLGL